MRIVVVGGVAGGMSAAARARRLDERAEIIVLERGPHVSFANCGLPYFVGGEISDEELLLVQTPEKLRAALNLDVRTGHDVIGLDAASKTLTIETADGAHELTYDALVLSPGASALRPPIEGLDSPRVLTLRTVEDALAQRELVEGGLARAVVIGAGFIGVEVAEALAQEGVETTLVEGAEHVLAPLEPELAWPVTQELQRLGIDVRSSTFVQKIVHGEAEDIVTLSDGSTVTAGLIVLSAGVRPDTAVFEAAGIECERGAIVVDEYGRASIEGVWAVGDAVVSANAVTGARRPVALAGPANRAGRQVAGNIIHPEAPRALPMPLATAIIRVGELTAAMTGANRSELEAAEFTFDTLHLHPNNHAGYFPGATPIHLVVHVRSYDGRILGAQAIGSDGVDKRIDVLATAIRGGMTVHDLIDLDLSYSPPYGSAKDAVNMAGMVGANVISGLLKLWYAQDLDSLEDVLFLDVRTEAEIASGMLPGALHIPHTQLRERLDEVRQAAAGRPVRVSCESGVRSAIAHRVLTQAGLDSASLSGGMQTLRAVLRAG